MTNDISELYASISTDAKLMKKWQREVNKRVRRFVRNVASASPFLDKPVKRMFGVRNSKDGKSLTIYGVHPNAGRMKAFNAPTDDWKPVTQAYRFFGDDGWRTIHKVQMAKSSAGVAIEDVPYFGTSKKPDMYFGIRKGKATLAYGRVENGLAVPVYAENDYPDWIMENYRDEIDRIVIEAGQDVLTNLIMGRVKK